MPAADFPCHSLPEDPAQARLLGLYPQRQEGLWMQRVRVPGGRLTAGQWRVLAEISRRFTPSQPLHLTTRQDVEFHGLAGQDVPALQAALAEAGLTGLGACGDAVRNITLCPGCGLCPGSVDLAGLAEAIHAGLAEMEGFFQLPRKFKISLSGCPRACGKPWINDLGFVAVGPAAQSDGADRPHAICFHAIGAGSLGARPAAGISLAERVEPAHVVALAKAALRVFAAHGDRQNRARARLRHVRQRLGDEVFLALLRQEFESESPLSPGGDLALPAPQDRQHEPLRLEFPDGDVTADAADALADLTQTPTRTAQPDAASWGRPFEARIDFDQGVLLYGRDEPSQRTLGNAPSGRSAVESFAALRVATIEHPPVVACPGTRWCKRALADTTTLAGAIRRRLRQPGHRQPQCDASRRGAVGCAATIRISGCPNGCAQHAVAAIGLLGKLATIDGRRQEVFDIFAGGGEGASASLARPTAQAIPADQVPALVQALAAR